MVGESLRADKISSCRIKSSISSIDWKIKIVDRKIQAMQNRLIKDQIKSNQQLGWYSSVLDREIEVGVLSKDGLNEEDADQRWIAED